jgi:soluble lytic murein transglycosylase-like protein
MSIDPRMLAEYVRLQMMSSMTLFNSVSSSDPYSTSDAAQTSDSSTDFYQMLQLMMQEGQFDSQSPSSVNSGSDFSAASGNPMISEMLPYASGNIKSASSLLQALQPLQAPFGYSPMLQESAPTPAATQIVAPSSTKKTAGGSAKKSDYDPIIEAASKKYGVSVSLIKAVIQAESGFRPGVVSSAGAKGLMQLMDGTAKALGVSNSFDPTQNINGGTKYLSQLIRRFNGDEAVALAAYNAGPGRVSRLGISNLAELNQKYQSLPRETQNYVKKVLAYQEKY